MRGLRRLAAFLAAVLLVPLAVAGGALLLAQTAPGRSALAAIVETLASTPERTLRIGGLTGTVPFDITVHGFALADTEGEWLRVDTARLAWRPFRLAAGELAVDALELGRMEILRAPIAADEEMAGGLPRLPVEVSLGRLHFAEIAFGPDLLGEAAVLTASGSARLGRPAEGLGAELSVQRIDGQPGAGRVEISYIPETEYLTTRLDLREDSGGLVSRLAGLPELPPLEMRIAGEGPLDDFRADLSLAAGEQGEASGTARLSRVSDGRLLAVDLDGRLRSLFSADYSPLAEGRTTLSLRAGFKESGRIEIERFEALAAAGLLTAQGHLDRQADRLDMAFEMVAGEAHRFGAVLPVAASWAGIEISGRIQGPLSEPGLDAEIIGERLTLEANRIDRLQATVSAIPQGPLGGPDLSTGFVLEGQAGGVEAADPRFARAVGSSVEWRLIGSGSASGSFDFREARLVVPAGELVWAGTVDPDKVDGRLTTASFDLAALSGFAETALAGRARLDAEISAALDGSEVEIAAEGEAQELSTGMAALDGVLGSTVALSGGARRQEDGSFAFDDLKLDGEAVELVADGTAEAKGADVEAAMMLSDLSRLDRRLGGQAQIAVTLTGSLADLALHARAELKEATALDRPLEGVVAKIESADVTGAARGAVTLSGMVDGKELSGGGRFSRGVDGGWSVSGVDVALGSLRLAGDLSLDAEAQAVGRLSLEARDLADVSTLALSELAGSLDAEVELQVVDGAQVTTIEASARELAYETVRIARLDLSGTVADPFGSLALEGRVNATSIAVGESRVDSLALLAEGGLGDSAINLTAQGFDGRLEAGGQLRREADGAALEVSALSLTRGALSATLASRSRLRLVDGAVETEGLVLRSGDGTLAVRGKAGKTLDLAVTMDSLPLSLLEVAAPGTGLAGSLSGRAQISGPVAAPGGSYELTAAQVQLPAIRQAGLSPLSVKASGQLRNERASLEATVSGEAGASLALSGSLPLAAEGALDLAVQGRIELAIFSDLLAATGDRISGPLDLELELTGPVGAPRIAGTAGLTGGRFSSPLNGIELQDIALQATGSDRTITISSLSARAGDSGSLTGSGRIELAPEAGFPLDLAVQADNAALVSSDIVTAVADADLTLRGPAMHNPTLGGRITIRQMDIELPDSFGGAGAVIEVEHRNTPPALAERLAQRTRPERSGSAVGPSSIGLDLVVAAPNQVFVRGQGLDAELGGEVTVRGTLARPIVIGGFDLRRGEVNLLAQRIQFSRGRITFPGDLDPELDLIADTRSSSITAQIAVTGRASRPQVEFSSTPELPEDEVLSRLLFDKATAELTPGEAIQLAQAVAQLTGVAGGSGGIVENIRRKLGVDVLDITAGVDGPAVGIGRYIDDNIFVGVRQGAKPDSSRVTVDIDVTKNIKARGEVGADGESSVGVSVEWDY